VVRERLHGVPNRREKEREREREGHIVCKLPRATSSPGIVQPTPGEEAAAYRVAFIGVNFYQSRWCESALSRHRESHRNSIAVDRIERISLSLSLSLFAAGC